MPARNEPDPNASLAALLDDAHRRAVRYLEALGERPVAAPPDAVERLGALREPLPAGPTDPARVLALLDDYVSPATIATAGPRFFGFVIGGALPASLAANWLAAAWDQNAALAKVTPGVALLEDVALGWMTDLLGLPAGTEGAYVTGATVANFTALAAARHAVLEDAGWNVEADGLFGAPPITVVIGDEAHPTLLKSLGLLGLGRTRLVRVPVDGQGRMRADAFPAIRAPAIVCLQAGNINTGAFDPFADVIPRAHECGAWVHVDGAFGLWAAAVPSLAHLATGMGDADSWATDAHKWLNVPYDSGLAFVRRRGSLPAAMAITAEYLPTDDPRRNPCDYTPELSRRARGVEVWAAMRSLGRGGLVEMFERNCRQARRFSAAFRAAGYETPGDVVLNQALVSFGTPEITERVIEAVQADGTCWAGVSRWQGHTVMRVSVSSWATTDEDVERSIEAVLRVAARVTGRGR
ncbi:MAG: pyridoxal-dependent decarboxylase [Steroidobacteraceae bacterium]